ncbi:MAG: helix-turn-helix domain-containing protein [Gammaproteobacteria bacterium]|nr:helix-turn-helix domain-containing protein [Gammaproteobacteria bacterium]
MQEALPTATPAFSDLLRSWRRTRKLSQGKLAESAGISQRHLSFLESGRSMPSRDMVLLLSQTLNVPLREQNSLLHAAGFAAVYSHDPIDAERLGHARQALDMMLEHHEPYPAVVVDRNWNLLLANEATFRLFAEFVDVEQLWSDIGGHAPNVLRATLHPKGLQPFIRNWRLFAGYFRHQLEEELATNPFNRKARELLEEISAYPDMPTSHAPTTASTPLLALEIDKGETRLELFTMITSFGTPLDVTLQEIRIEMFFPANEAAKALFRRLSG